MPSLLTFPFPSFCWGVGSSFQPTEVPLAPGPFPTQGREGAAGTSWMGELLLAPFAGIHLGPSQGICRFWGVPSSLGRQGMGEVLRSSPSTSSDCSSLPPCLVSSWIDFGDHLPRSPTDPRDPLGPFHHPPDLPGDSLASWDGRLWEGWGASPLPCEPPTPGGPRSHPSRVESRPRALCLYKPCWGSPGAAAAAGREREVYFV